MTTDRIAQIKADAEDHRRYNPDDVPFLLAEVERLTAECNRFEVEAERLREAIWRAYPNLGFDVSDGIPTSQHLADLVVDAACEARADRDAATERESARWGEALTSDEVREAVADAITYHPGNRLGTPEQRQNASALLALIALRAAADTIRGDA